MKTIDYAVELAVGVAPETTADATTAITGTGVDTLEFQDARLAAMVGAAAGSPTTQPVTFKVQESSDNGASDAFADVAGATVTITADDTAGDIEIPDMVNRERYLRVVATPALTGGSSPVIPVTAFLELGKKIINPVD